MKKNLSQPIPKVIILILIIILGIESFLSVYLGTVSISWLDITKILLQQLSLNISFSEIIPWQETVIISIRLPRVFVSILIGAGLAICGVVMQAIFRNPLASPAILGVSSGASLGGVLAMFFGMTAVTTWMLPLFSGIGATITLFSVYYIAKQHNRISTTTLLLAGIAIGTLNTALLSLILSLSLSDWELGRMLMYWTMGELDGKTWSHVMLLLPLIVFGSMLIYIYYTSLDALSIGVDVHKVRTQLLIITTVMIGAMVSVAGAIGFIGLIVPHVFRLLIGPKHKYLIPASALGGAILLVTVDLVLRTWLLKYSIPIGVATAMLGAPFFILLLLKNTNHHLI